MRNFFYDIYLNLTADQKSSVIVEVNNTLVVNFILLFERDYSISAADQLIYQLHKLGQGKRFLFVFDDGVLLRMTNAVEIIKNIIKTFNLNSDSCAVFCREPINFPGVTVIYEDSIELWARQLYPYIKGFDIPQGPFSKRFAVWFNRGTFYRTMLAEHLQTNHADNSYISYQESGMLRHPRFEQYFEHEIAWASANTPIVYDEIFTNRSYTYEQIVGDRKPYNDYFMEIIVETDSLTTGWITEKTIKNLYIGKPFLVMSGARTLEKLRSFGFKTFGSWIDETYDTIDNNHLRLEAIKREIDRLAGIDVNQMYQELLPILEHNRQTYGKYITSGR